MISCSTRMYKCANMRVDHNTTCAVNQFECVGVGCNPRWDLGQLSKSGKYEEAVAMVEAKLAGSEG